MTRDEAIKFIEGKRISEWNAYRRVNRKWKPILSSFEFPEGSVEYLDLTYVDLRNAKFPKIHLDRLRLAYADLRGADLSTIKIPWGSPSSQSRVLTGAKYDLRTKWPNGFSPTTWGAVFVSEGGSIPMTSHKVFLSYAWADKKVVLAIDQWLRNKGLDTRIDERDFFAGAKIRDAIVNVMKTCEAVVIFYSEYSKEKPWPEFERELASDLEIEAKKESRNPPRIIYVVIGDLDLPSVTERNRLAVMTSGKRFPIVCEEVYRGILGISRAPESIDLHEWESYEF